MSGCQVLGLLVHFSVVARALVSGSVFSVLLCGN